MEETVLTVEGMTCGGCVISVENALSAVRGVKSVKVSLEKKEAKVAGEGLDRDRLQMALQDAGYELGV